MVKFKVEVNEIVGECSNGMKVGDHFFVENDTIRTAKGTKFCMWALSKMLIVFPLLMEKKNINKNHWIHDFKTTKCPDGKVKFSITEIE